MNSKSQGCLFLGGAVAVAALILFVTMFVSVPFGHVRLVKQFGALTGKVLEPGAHFIAPWQGTEKVSLLVNSWEASEYPDDSGADYTDFAVGGQTFDGQQITITCTVLFRIPNDHAISVLTTYGDVDMMVENVVKTYTRSFAREYAQTGYTASDLYGSRILEYEQTVQDALNVAFTNAGIVLDDFLVRKISFSEEYVNAVEAKQIAEEAIKTAEFRSQAAKFEADLQVALAKGQAEQQVLLAEAQATQIKLLADADAYAIEAKGLALQTNPNMIQWEFISHLSGVDWGILPGDSLNLYIPTK